MKERDRDREKDRNDQRNTTLIILQVEQSLATLHRTTFKMRNFLAVNSEHMFD